MAARGTAGVLEEVRRGMKTSTGVRLGPGEGGATAQAEGVVLTSVSMGAGVHTLHFGRGAQRRLECQVAQGI